MKYHRKSKRTGQWDKSHCPVRHCFSALSPLDVGHYAYRGEITKSTGVSLTLTQAEDFVFSLKRYERSSYRFLLFFVLFVLSVIRVAVVFFRLVDFQTCKERGKIGVALSVP